MVQVDTLEVRPLRGVAFKHFTARDMVSRWDVIQAHSGATARTATAFLGGAASADALSRESDPSGRGQRVSGRFRAGLR